jgi:hypothetical protein
MTRERSRLEIPPLESIHDGSLACAGSIHHGIMHLTRRPFVK